MKKNLLFQLPIFFVLFIEVKDAKAICSASFAFTSPVCAGQTITFTNTSTGSMSSYFWNFGGGPSDTSSLQNPTHIFNTPGNYVTTLIITGNNCNDTTTQNIVVLPVPNAQFSFSPGFVCTSSSVQFTNTSTPSTGVTYTWNFGDTASGPSNTSSLLNPTHTFSTTGNHTVCLTVTSTSSGCTNTVCHTVNVNQSPVPQLQDVNIFSAFNNCGNISGNPIYNLIVNNITSTPWNVSSYTINWGDMSSSVGLTNASFPVSHTYTSYGIFTLTITATGTNGCVGTTIYTVINQTNPAVGITGPGNTQGCAPAGYWFHLTQYQLNTSGTYYIWNFGDGTQNVTWLTVGVDSIYHVFTATSCGQPGNQFIVSVAAVNGCDSTVATVNNIKIGTKPIADFTAPLVACISNPVVFNNTTVPGYNLPNCNQIASYYWNFGDPGSGSQNTSTAVSPSHVFSTTGIFNVTLIASGQCGSDTAVKTICIVGPPTSVFSVSPSNGCIPLAVQATNNSNTITMCDTGTFQWTVSYSAAFCETSPSWAFTNGTTPSSVNPSFVFSNAGIYTISLTATNVCGTVLLNQNVNAKKPPLVNLSSVSNSCGPLTIIPSATVTNCGSTGPSYLWTFAGGTPSSSTLPNPPPVTFSSIGSHTITVAVTNECGTATASTSFSVLSVPSVTVTLSTSVCSGQSAALSASGATTYTWTPGTGLSATTGANVTATPSSTTTYTVTGTSNGCTSSAQVTVTVNPIPIIIVSPSIALCAGQSTTLTANGATTYTWTPATGLSATTGSTVTANPNSTTTYTVSGTSNGCTATAQVIVTVNPIPIVTVSPPITLCTGQSILLSAGGASTYSWTPATGLSATTGSTVTANPLSTITYTVTGANNNCTATAQVTVTVNPIPIVTVSLSTTLCSGQSTNLTAGGTATSYTWSPSTGLSSTTGTSVTATPASTTMYTVTGTGVNGCTASVTVTVTVNQPPLITVTPTVPQICVGGSIALTASGGVSYSWSPATGLSSTTGATVTANPASTITYTIIGTDANGCIDTTSVTVNVNPLPNVVVTTNNDTICQGQPAVLTASGAVNYTWAPATGLSSTTGSIVTATPTSTTTYIVTGINGANCQSTDTIIVYVLPQPVITVNSSGAFCIGGFSTLTATGGVSYIWSPSMGLSSTTGTTVTATPASTTMYTVTGTGVNGCTASVTVTVTVNQPPLITVSPTVPQICVGGSIALTASGGISYSWSPATGLSSTTGATVTANPASTITYTIIGTDANGCIDTTSVTVNVNPLPNVLVTTNNDTICEGQPAVLTASGAVNYTWAPATGLSSTTGSIVTATPPSTTTYIVTGINGANCQSTDTILVFVNPLPNVTVNAATICSGQSVTLTASGASTYLWSTSSTASSIIVSPTITTSYIVTGTNAATGCSNTATSTVTVNPVPVAAFISPATVCVNVPFSINNTSLGGSTYNWDFGDLTFSSLQNPTHAYSSIGTFTITLIVSTSGNCSDTISSSVNVIGPPVASFQLSSNNGCGPLTVSVVNLSSAAMASYFWDFGNGITSISSSPSAIMYVASALTDTTYYVSLTVSNACGTSVSTDSVVVHPMPLADFGTDINEGCSPLTIQFSNTSAGNPQSYLWIFGNGNTSTLPNPGPQIYTTGNNDSIYVITLIITNGCGTDTITRQILVHPNTVNAFFNTAPTSGCVPLTVNFTDFSTGGTLNYNWNFGNSNFSNQQNPSCVYSSPGMYTVTLIVSNGCSVDAASQVITVYPAPVVNFSVNTDSVCSGESFSFTNLSQNVSSLSWDFGDATTSTLTNPTHTYSQPGTYTVTLTAVSAVNACSGSTVQTVTVLSTPQAAFTLPVNYGCQPLAVNFINTSVNGNFFFWDFGDGGTSTLQSPVYTFSDSGTFIVTLIAGNSLGCSDTTTTTVTVYPKPNAGFLLSDSVACSLPANVSFTNTSVGAIAYNWDFGNSQNSVQVNPTTTYNAYGSFPVTLIATSLQSCKDTAIKYFNAYTPPIADFFVNETTGCAPFTVLFSNNSVNGVSYYWSFGDNEPSTDVSPGHTFNQAGTYIVTLVVTGVGGCIDSFTLSTPITVLPSPTADFTFTADNIPSFGGNFIFTNTSVNAVTYYWDFGDGGNSSEENPEHRYDYPGTFYTTLTATATNLCHDTEQKKIEVGFFYGLFIPNAFIPLSADEGVRTFKPAGVGLIEYRIEIFDTWGNPIWSSTLIDEHGHPAQGWDGYYNGNLCQQDAYVWKVWAVFQNDKIWEGKKYEGVSTPMRTGTVTLIR